MNLAQTDAMTKLPTYWPPPTPGAESDTITATLTRSQAEALLRAGQYVYTRGAIFDAADVMPSWLALADGIEALKGAVNGR